MVAFFLFPSALADQRQLYQAGFMAPTYGSTYAASSQMYAPYAPAVPEMYAAEMSAPYAPVQYPAAYPVYEEEVSDNSEWSDVAMLAVAGAVVGAVIGYKTKSEKVSMLGVSGTEATMMDKLRNTALAGLVSVGLMSTPVVANAVDVKLGSDGGQLVFVPDEVTIKAGESVTWLGNKGMPHNVVFDEENVPDGTDLAKLNHEDMINDEGEKVTSKFDKPGTYGYYCEPHRGAGMNATVVVK
jgi:plastocyanin